MWLFWRYTDQPTWGGIAPGRGRCTYVHFIQPQYVDLDRRYYGTPILYCTILHYTTLPVSIYLYFLRELVIRCATYLPTTYLLSVSMVWYGMVWVGGCQLPRLFLK